MCDHRAVRFVVYGAGAIGGVVGAGLLRAGYEVAMIARGAHGAAITRTGLRVESPDGPSTVRPSAVADRPEAVEWRADDAVLLAVKSQDTAPAVAALARWAPPTVAVACLQNGVANEPTVLRWFPRVYGVTVMCPAAHLEPGTVVAYSSPVAALLDVGRYPTGEGEVEDGDVGVAARISAAFNASGMDSVVRSDIMRWKYAKLVLLNLANAVDALCGPRARGGTLARLVQEEGTAVLAAAGIAMASEEEDRPRRGSPPQMKPVPGQPRGGSSSWQSLARATGSIETDYLNGEIVLLGRLHGVPTPANEHVRRLANRAAVEGWRPGSCTESGILDDLSAAPA